MSGERRYRSVPISHALPFTTVTADSPIEKLNRELSIVYEQISLREHEVKTRMDVFHEYKALIEKSFPCVVDIFGSTKTTLMIHESDIDLTVLVKSDGRTNDGRDAYDDSKQFANFYLSKIHQIVASAGCAGGRIVHIKHARTPILKFTEKRRGLKIDISINKLDGLETAAYIVKQLGERPYLRYLAIPLKYFLKRRCLGDTSLGGLCAYAQFLLVLNFCQLHPLIQTGSVDVRANLGVLLLDFFQYFGIDFPFERTAISVSDARYKPCGGMAVCIEDPVADGNNVASGCTSIGMIKSVFAYGYKIMAAALTSSVDMRKGVAGLWVRLDASEVRARPHLQRARPSEVSGEAPKARKTEGPALQKEARIHDAKKHPGHSRPKKKGKRLIAPRDKENHD